MCAIKWFSGTTPTFSVLIEKPEIQRILIEDEREYLAATNIVNPDETSYLVYSTKSIFSPTISSNVIDVIRPILASSFFFFFMKRFFHKKHEKEISK